MGFLFVENHFATMLKGNSLGVCRAIDRYKSKND